MLKRLSKNCIKEANILGTGPCKGNYLAGDILKFVNTFVTLKPTQKPYVFRPHMIANFCTTFDLDFRFREETVIADDEIIEIAKKCQKFTEEITGKVVQIMITRKNCKVYPKESKREGKFFASGCHFYFCKHRFTKSEMVAVRQKMNTEVLSEKFNFLGIEEIIDTCVFPFGNTGIYLLGSPKPGTAYRHEFLAVIAEENEVVECNESFDREHVQLFFENQVVPEDCYISVNEVEVVGKSAEKLAKKKKEFRPSVENYVLEMRDDWNFNLKYFFEVMKDYRDEIGMYENWKTLCWFLKETNIPSDHLAKALNTFFEPEKPEENFKMMENRQIRTSCKLLCLKRKELIEIMGNCGVEFDYWKLFFPHRFDTIDDVYGICHNTVVWDNKHQHKNKLKQCFSSVRQKGNPVIHYKRKDLIGVRKMSTQQLRVHHTTGDYDDVFLFYKDEDKKGNEVIVRKKLSAVVKDLAAEQELHVYTGIVCVPYFRECSTHPHLLNIYEPPDIAFYKSTKPFKFEGSVWWKHLTEIIAKEDSYKVEWIFTYIATKIQSPARKVEKTLVLVAETTGCGKSSFFHFMTALLGVNNCFEFTDVGQLKQKFNAHLSGKLLVLVDDIDKLTKKQQDALKTTCTQKHFKVEKKGFDSTLEKCFFDSILTSNTENNIFISCEDRRTEPIYVSDKYRQSEKNKWFWDEFYSGLEDMCKMKVIYEYFANYKIKLDIRNKDVRFDRVKLQERKAGSLGMSFEFLRTMFEDPHWIPSDTEVFKNGVVRVGSQRLFDVFQYWKKNNGITMPKKRSSFEQDLLSIGFETVRRRRNGGRSRKYELSPLKIQTALLKFGKVDVLQGGLEDTIESWKDSRRMEIFAGEGHGFVPEGQAGQEWDSEGQQACPVVLEESPCKVIEI